MRILLVGGAGVIGSILEAELRERGHKTCVFDTFLDSAITQEEVKGLPVTGTSASLSNMKSIFFSFKPEVVFHFADDIIEEDGSYDPFKENSVCSNTTLNILRCVKEHRVEHVFFGSSCEVYSGDSKRRLKENSPVSPVSFTGYSKKYSEDIFSLESKISNFNFTSIRYFQVYGNRKVINPKHDIISFLSDYIVSNDPLFIVGAEKYQDFLSAKEATSATISIFENAMAGHFLPVVNVGSGDPLSLKFVASTLKSLVPEYSHKFRYLPANTGTRSLVSDNSLLKSLGWKRSKNFEASLLDILDYRKSLQVSDPYVR